MKIISILLFSLIGSTSFSQNQAQLKNISLLIDNSTKPSNTFITCAANKAVDFMSAEKYEVFSYSHSFIGDEAPIIHAGFMFLVKEKATGNREVLNIVLESLDSGKGWQMLQSGSTISSYSTAVSSVGVLNKWASGSTVNEKLGELDLSSCQP